MSETDGNNKNNELVVRSRETDIPWVIGVSKTHPGLKYYFNTVTGVSLWNICKEDMERAKQSMQANGNLPQDMHCPEPKEAPPSTRLPIKIPALTLYDHVSHYSRTNSINKNMQINNHILAKESLGYSCDVVHNSAHNSTPSNIITVNIQPYSNPAYVDALGTHPQRQMPFSPSVLDTSLYTTNHHNVDVDNLIRRKRSLNTSFTERMSEGSNNEHLNDQSTTNSDVFDGPSNFETLDLAPLFRLAKPGELNDKWYIIADTSVYLHHIDFLKSVVNSDNLCYLMVPHNVKSELESATKTQHRTKAHYANYYIYNMFDYGFAIIDDNYLEHSDKKSNEKHILDSCSKLKEQNSYVVIISNDLELQKHKKTIPVFTVAQLKEYLCRSGHYVTTKSPESTPNIPLSEKNIEVSSFNNPIHNLSDPKTTKKDEAVQQSQSINTSLLSKDTGIQIDLDFESKKTANADVQTNFSFTQIEELENLHRKICDTNQDISKTEKILMTNCQTYELPLPVGIRKSGIKLRRKKICNQNDLKLPTVKVNETQNKSNILSVSSHNDVLPCGNYLNDQDRNMLNTNDSPKLNGINKHNVVLVSSKNDGVEIKYITSKQVNNRTAKEDQHKIFVSTNNENKNVMFEITTETMEKSLRRRSDEWMSRFVQIMEEALTQVLRKNSSLYLPPPWNMYEAAICIGKMFKDDEDVADASKKFLNVLNKISNERGYINANISPTQYMEIYSFGVYLIDALQSVFSTCEDLQIAAESLSKLLVDIQDPQSDISNLESLQCLSLDEHSVNDTRSSNNEVKASMTNETVSFEQPSDTANNIQGCDDKSVDNCVTTKQLNLEIHNPSPALNDCGRSTSENNLFTKGNYSTSPTEEKIVNQEETTLSQPIPQIITNNVCKSTFLSNFLLRNKDLKRNITVTEKLIRKNDTKIDISEDKPPFSNVSIDEQCLRQTNRHVTSLPENTISDEPKIVRNFVMCSEFEKRLKKRKVHDEIDELYFEDKSLHYMDPDETSGDTGRLHIDEFIEFNHNDEDMEQELEGNIEYIKVDFKYFIRKIAQEIRELSSEVYSFGENACNSTLDDRSHIKERAEEMYLYVEKLCTALTNILSRDKNSGFNVQAILRNTEFYDILVEEEQMDAYGTFIERCLDLGYALRDTVKEVLSVAR